MAAEEGEANAARLKLNRAGFAVLMMEVKALQGVMGVFTQFENELKTLKKQINAINKEYETGIVFPEVLNPMELTRAFFELSKQAHPYPHHLDVILGDLEADTSVYLKSGVLERFLHSLDRVAPNFYQSHLHKMEVKEVIIQMLEDCYDEIEDLQEEAELEDNALILDEET